MIDEAGLSKLISNTVEKPDFAKNRQTSRPPLPDSLSNDSINTAASKGSMYERDSVGAHSTPSEDVWSEQTTIDQDDRESMKSALHSSNIYQDLAHTPVDLRPITPAHPGFGQGHAYEQDLAGAYSPGTQPRPFGEESVIRDVHSPSGTKYEQDLANDRSQRAPARSEFAKGHMYEQDLGLAQTKLRKDGHIKHPELTQTVANHNDLAYTKQGGIYNEINQGWERGERVGTKATYQVENRLTEDQRMQWLYSPENKAGLMDRLKAPEKGAAVVKAVTKMRADGTRDLYLFPKATQPYHGQVGGYIVDSGAESMLKNGNIFRLDGNSQGYQTLRADMQKTAEGLLEQYPQGLFDPKFTVQKSIKGYDDYPGNKKS